MPLWERAIPLRDLRYGAGARYGCASGISPSRPSGWGSILHALRDHPVFVRSAPTFLCDPAALSMAFGWGGRVGDGCWGCDPQPASEGLMAGSPVPQKDAGGRMHAEVGRMAAAIPLRTYCVVVEPEPDGSAWNMSAPALAGCFTNGATVPEALEHMQEAIGWRASDASRTLGNPRIHQRITGTKVSFEPELAHQRPGLHKLPHARGVGCRLGLGVSVFVPIQHPHLVWPRTVQEEGRMRRHQDLRVFRRPPALFPEVRQQPWMEKVLRFFDTDELRRIRVH